MSDVMMSDIGLIKSLNQQSQNQPSRPYGGYAGGVHLFPYRTEKLSPPWPMVLVHQPGE